jgi:hypothetical protein
MPPGKFLPVRCLSDTHPIVNRGIRDDMHDDPYGHTRYLAAKRADEDMRRDEPRLRKDGCRMEVSEFWCHLARLRCCGRHRVVEWTQGYTLSRIGDPSKYSELR